MITFRSVTKKFGETTALSEVSFRVDKGEMVLITGPSGSGKTSLMRLLIKEYEPTTGEIMFDDEPLAKIGGRALPYHRRRIGVVFQDYKLLPELNIWENIALPLSIIGKSQAETESRVTDLLKLIGLTSKAALFPSQLSGGEAQRVSIARALATGPSVIFADEPTGNLDPETSLSIARLLRQINRLGTTLLLATHDGAVLSLLADERRIALHKGTLADDTHPKKVEMAESVEEISTQEKASPKPAHKSTTATDVSSSIEDLEEDSTSADKKVVAMVEDLDEDAVEISLHSSKKPKSSEAKKTTDKPKENESESPKHTKTAKSDHSHKKTKDKHD
jgi:cell division transport system ATP-binding protein